LVFLPSCKKETGSVESFNRNSENRNGGNTTITVVDVTNSYTESSTIAPCTTGPMTCPLPVWTSLHTFYVPELAANPSATVRVYAISSQLSNWIELTQANSLSGLSFYPGAGAFSRSSGTVNTAIGAMSVSTQTLTFSVRIVATTKKTGSHS